MRSPLAVVIEDELPARDEARRALERAGIQVVAVATPEEAAEILRSQPHAVVAAMAQGASTPKQVARLAMLCRLRAAEGESAGTLDVDGRSDAAQGLRLRLRELAAAPGPVLFAGEAGSGRTHAARCLHALSHAEGPFLVVAADDAGAVETALTKGTGTLFLPSIERASFSLQERLAAILGSGNVSARLAASSSIDPVRAAGDGLLAPALAEAVSRGIVRVPALRERPVDIGALAGRFVDDVCRLNALPPIAIADDAMRALQAYAWPGNAAQLRSAVEAAVIVARDATVRAADLPEYLRGAPGTDGQAARRFRDAKRTVVDAFERAYLEELLRRHGGNVTGAAEHSGMLRSALQRLLRKHDLHSADFRRRGGPDHFAS